MRILLCQFIHIRYTDRKMPLAPFRNALRAELDRRPGAGIFLATDSAQVQAEFEKEFGKIHYIDKHFVASGARLHSPATQLDKQREAENALIDMWALSRCDHLIYSKNSTFSVCSALIGDLTARQQTDVDRYNPKIVIKRLVQPYL